MSIFSFGLQVENIPYKVLNEREIRASSGIMLLIGVIASIQGFILQNYVVLPYFTGFLFLNFILSAVINPKISPIGFLAYLLVKKQTPIYMGAIQKRFAWSLGSLLSGTIFMLTFKLLHNVQFFEPVCFLCLVCILLLYLETAFAICVGCKLYALALKVGIIKQPVVAPNCMGDSCKV